MPKLVNQYSCPKENSSTLKPKESPPKNKYVITLSQANIVKQSKLKEKKDVVGKAKFEKTTDNWKAASQDFRAALKAIKKE